MHFLTDATRDERLVLVALGRKAAVTLDKLQRNQARHIVDVLAKAMR
jgi:low affinity Fe/Cu permease